MSHKSIGEIELEIKNANNEINKLLDLNKIFLTKELANSTPQQIPFKLEASESGIIVQFFGCYTVAARPRIVRLERGGDFVVEYIFFIEQFDERHEIWRFYLTPQGPTRDGVCNPVPNVLTLPLSLNHARNLEDGVTYTIRHRGYQAMVISQQFIKRE